MVIRNVGSSVENQDVIYYLNDVLETNGSNLNICHLNARSIPQHIDEISNILTRSKMHICAVSESFLKPNSPGSSFRVPGFKVVRNDRCQGRGGGVLLYLPEYLKHEIVAQSEHGSNIEYLFVKICFSNIKILVGVCYNPPPSNNKIQSLSDLLQDLSSRFHHVVLLGDFNINLLSNANEVKRLKAIAKTCSLEFLKLQPTCHSPISPNSTLIDHILVKNPQFVVKFGQRPVSGISEHDLIFLSYRIRVPKLNITAKYIKNFKAVNQSLLLHQAHSLNWNGIYGMACVDGKLEALMDNILFLLETCVPSKRVLQGPKSAPWYNNSIKMAEVDRDRAYNLWLRTRDEDDRKVFCTLRNKVTSLKRSSKSSFFRDKLKKSERNGKAFYSNLNSLIAIDCQAPSSSFNANDLNKHFSSHESKPLTIPLPSGSHDNESGNAFNFQCIDSEELLAAINGIKSNSVGSDGIPRQFILLLLPVIFPFLLHIFNYIITSSTYPSAWKRTIVVPIPKCKSPKNPSDYRPIGILPYLSKVFEFTLKQQMDNHFESNQLLDPLQSGFRKFHGTNTALLKISSDISKSLDENQICIQTLLDFSNAFGVLEHILLLQKLFLLFHFSPLACLLLFSYFSNRMQMVRFNGQVSEWIAVVVGLVQGGLLSTGLFSAHVNDLPRVVSHGRYHSYADDFQHYAFTFNNPQTISSTVSNIEKDLAAISLWAERNGISLNIAKTQTIIYSKSPTQYIPPLTLHGAQIPFSESVKNLGVYFDSNLGWESHINNACGKIYGTLGRLFQIKDCLSTSTRLRIVKTMVLPYVLFGSVLFWNAKDKYLRKLRKAVNACTRFVFGIPSGERLGDTRNIILGMSLRNFLQFKTVMFLFKLMENMQPSYLFSQLKFSQSTRNCRNLVIPISHSRVHHSSFLVSGASLWNSLPGSLKNTRSLSTFRELAFNHFKN